MNLLSYWLVSLSVGHSTDNCKGTSNENNMLGKGSHHKMNKISSLKTCTYFILHPYWFLNSFTVLPNSVLYIHNNIQTARSRYRQSTSQTTRQFYKKAKKNKSKDLLMEKI